MKTRIGRESGVRVFRFATYPGDFGHRNIAVLQAEELRE
jgi:hypothetical protein